MTEKDPRGSRRLDGFSRRQPPPVPAAAKPAPKEVDSKPKAPVVATSSIEPVKAGKSDSDFSYRRNVVKRPKKKRRWKLWTSLAVLILIIGIGGFLGLKLLLAANKVITKKGTGSPLLASTTVDPSKLKHQGDGRINILLLGIGGEGHDGANLSDTIMIMSIDPKNKNVAMLSIPRDLYVKIPGYGYGKINSANSDGGPALAEKVVENVTGVPIHYYMQVDFSGFKQAVDAVGGVDIDVPTALYDPSYPCETGYGYCPYRQAAGETHMNGLSALRYSRCRHDDPNGSGANCGNDEGRSQRQQQVITALRKKALSAGTLTNPVKLASLIDAVGDHVKTDLQLDDMKQLALIAKDIDTTKIVNKVLNFTGPDAVLTATSNEAGSVLVPQAGEFDYTDIQNLAQSIFVDPYITSENALVQVQNGSGVTGLAGAVVTNLKAAHYNVMGAATAAQTYSKTVIYDNSKGKKPYTVNYLQEKFGVTAIQGTPPAAVATTSTDTSGTTTTTAASTQTPDIVVILGSDYSATTTTSSSLSSTTTNQ